MPSWGPEHEERAPDDGFFRGVIVGVLICFPFWIGVAIAAVRALTA